MLEISSALAGARGLVDLASTALAARDHAKVQEALQGLNEKLLALTTVALANAEKAMTLQASLVEAQHINAELERQIADRERYRLQAITPGAFAYRSQPQAEGDDPAHYLCQPCYDKGIKAVLREIADTEYRRGKWVCPESSSHAVQKC